MLPAGFLVFHRGLKLVAIAIGFAVSVIGLMSAINLMTGNGWVQVIGALILSIALPAFIADRFLPHDDEVPVPGLVSDVFALVLFGMGLGFVAAGRPLLVREAHHFWAAGSHGMAKATFFLAGVSVTETPQLQSSSPVASTSTSASSGSSAPSAWPSASASAPAAQNHPERTPAEIFKEWAPSVVSIKVKLGHGVAGGTGFAVDDQGTIATNHHVIAGATEVRVKLMNGKWMEDIELLTEDKERDLALLKIDLHGETLKAVVRGDSGFVTVGERAISIGNPLGLEHTLTDGLVSSRRVIEGQPFIQLSVPVSPGNSGGPMFNIRGEVIGVTVAQINGGLFGGAQNLNLAIPINALSAMITGNYPKRHKFSKEDEPGTW